MAEDEASKTVEKVLQSAREVRLGKGVVGKTGHIVIGTLAVWGGVVWRLGENPVANGTLLIAGMIATLFAFWWIRSIQSFAERNPAQAMLEGAEFLEYRRLEVQAKGTPALEQQPSIIDASDTIPPVLEAS